MPVSTTNTTLSINFKNASESNDVISQAIKYLSNVKKNTINYINFYLSYSYFLSSSKIVPFLFPDAALLGRFFYLYEFFKEIYIWLLERSLIEVSPELTLSLSYKYFLSSSNILPISLAL